MEGSRHEKATVLILSYVIGFVTAFILFSGNVQFLPKANIETAEAPVANTNSASAIQAERNTPKSPNEVSPEMPRRNNFDLSYENGLLEVTVNRTQNLLSFNPDVTNNTTFDLSSPQGFHYGNIVYKASADNSFVFFCEKHDIEAEACYGFVYDVKGDRIYPIIKDGEVALVSDQSAAEAIWTVLGLKVGSNYSANATAPWVLIDAN